MKKLLLLLLLVGCKTEDNVDYLSYPWLCDKMENFQYSSVVLMDCTNLSDNSHVNKIINPTNILEVR